MSKALAQLRKQLDDLDRRVVEVLAERFALVEEVASLKQADSGTLRDLTREEEVFARLETLATDAGLNKFLRRPVV